MDAFCLLTYFFQYFCYPICIIIIALELHRYIYMRYLIEEKDDYESHEPSIEMCSRCKNSNCSHRIAEYTND